MKINYKISGTPNSPVLVLSNSLGSTMAIWDELVPLLLPYFSVLQYDTRGHGGSIESVENQEYSISLLADDVIQLLDRLQIEKAYFCGLSMGGLIGQQLGLHYPKRFFKIALSNTGAKIGDNERWNNRIEIIRKNGMQAIVEDTLLRWFSDDFRQNQKEKVLTTKNMFLASNVQGYSNSCAAIRDADFRESLDKFSVPALIITGDEDPVTNVEEAEYLAKIIPDSRLKVLSARHLSATESPNDFAKALIDFFVGTETIDRGMHVRRTVLGNPHVDKSIANTSDFNSDFQSFISNYAWGEIWTRPGLNKHSRSLITLSMLIALNRQTEFKMHVRAAINNGVSKDEIKEVIMQSALYCGLPAANEAFHVASEVFSEMEF
jgi:3-oxoadipate enol-lactonase / 4-carboxymuconolactone decarboxylase